MFRLRSLLVYLLLLGTVTSASAQETAWKPAPGPLVTRWTRLVTPETAHREYPRPQLVREGWTNLNGLWDYTIRTKGATAPQQFDGKILVPFPIESALSGVATTVGQEKELWYRRPFAVQRPKALGQPQLLLHFGAVDWQTTVWVNGRQVGQHSGGYDPFTFDITDALSDGEKQELLVRVWDPTDDGVQPRGKQVKEPRGIWYTSVTGIWQTVWTEWVPAVSIERLELTPDVETGQVRVAVKLRGTPSELKFSAEVRAADTVVARQEGALGSEPLHPASPTVVARRSLSVFTEIQSDVGGRRARGRSQQLLRDADHRNPRGRIQDSAAGVEWTHTVSIRSAGSGLVARRIVYRSHRRRAAI
jgi:hypothetical protein